MGKIPTITRTRSEAQITFLGYDPVTKSNHNFKCTMTIKLSEDGPTNEQMAKVERFCTKYCKNEGLVFLQVLEVASVTNLYAMDADEFFAKAKIITDRTNATVREALAQTEA